jgi:molybdopterin molybdotransferase
MTETLLPVTDALARILALIAPTAEETVALIDASGRALSRPVASLRTQPPFPASAMDGYAVHSADIRPGGVLTVIGEARAGARHDAPVAAGQAVRIFTGAPVPDGADRILIQEDADRDGDHITVRDQIDTQAYVRPAGLDFAAGTQMPVRRLSPQDIALLAAFNLAELPVRKRPVIALIATGDELVEPGETPGPDQIVSSNAYGLHALLRQHGGDPRILPIARDTRASLKAALAAARGADLIVTLGGASVGDHDLVREVFGGEGLDLSFYKINMRPGKPLMAGRIAGGPPMLGLPGNPVSAMVCAHLFLRPVLDAFAGLPAGPLPRRRAPLAEAIGANGGREHYARAALIEGPDGPVLKLFGRQDSSVLSVLSNADCLAVLPPRLPAQDAGQDVDYIQL